MDFTTLMKTDSDEQFAKAVLNINERGKALDLDIQRYLAAVAARWKQTGDVRPAVNRVNMLIDKKTLFKGVRRNAIIAWVETMLGFEYLLDGPSKDQFHANKATAKGFEMADIVKQENHWYNLTKEPDPKPLDLNVLIKALVAKAEARASKHLAEDRIPEEQLRALKALVLADAPAAAKEVDF